MRVGLEYGDGKLWVELPDDRTIVIEPISDPAISDPENALRKAIREPIASPQLRDIVSSGQSVAISICDITRPQLRVEALGAILSELEGITRPEDLVILIATGTHRANTSEELEQMLGPEILSTYRVVNHLADDPSTLVDIGVIGDGVPVSLNKEWVTADIRITTGVVEPHFFAGFSGGQGNPVHSDVRAIAQATGVDFALDVTLNRDHQITGAFAGDLFAMHEMACEKVRETSMQPVESAFDIVITSNSGYPLDQNLYQMVKGMSAAAEIVKPGGTIVCVAECRDGLPNHGSFGEILCSKESPEELEKMIHEPGYSVPDQWQVQIQARIQRLATVLMKSDGLTDEQIRMAHLEPIHDVEATVMRLLEKYGEDATLCVLPQGPRTIPYLQ